MNLVSLVVHGLAGIASFNDVVATRILITNVFGMVLTLVFLGSVILIRLETALAIPGWATYSTGLLLLLLAQLLISSFGLVFLLMATRTAMTFVPIRDYKVFVDRVRNVWSKE
jgi:hypothetical protein